MVSLSADQQASWLNLTVHSEHNHWMQPCNHRLIELLSVHSFNTEICWFAVKASLDTDGIVEQATGEEQGREVAS